jgi:hypothetical protein
MASIYQTLIAREWRAFRILMQFGLVDHCRFTLSLSGMKSVPLCGSGWGPPDFRFAIAIDIPMARVILVHTFSDSPEGRFLRLRRYVFMKRSVSFLLGIIMVGAAASAAFAWGDDGHQTVGKIASLRIKPRTSQKIAEAKLLDAVYAGANSKR